MPNHRTAARDEWLAERLDLLKAEKELTRLNDDVARKRRELPWVPVEKDYVFDTEDGKATLADLEQITPETAKPEDYIDLAEVSAFNPEVMDGECSA